MSDKFRKSFPISITFSDGEIPTALKVSAIAHQAQIGQGIIEYALGDLWNQSGDQLLTSPGLDDYALMIPNLARMMGGSMKHGPKIPYLPNIEQYTFHFPTSSARTREVILDFPVAAGCATWTWGGTAPRPSGAPQATAGAVNATGEWYVDYTTGKCVFFDEIRDSWQLTYEPVVHGDLGDGFTWNVMPDPETVASYGFQSCKIAFVNGTDNTLGYYIYLPPRGPLQNARRLSDKPQDNTHTPAHIDNYSESPTAELWMWQSDTELAPITDTYAEHYRYNLPEMITDNWSASSRLPAGLVRLWDPIGSGTILEGLTLSAENDATPRTWMFVASGTALDSYLATTTGLARYPTAALQSSSHASTYYPAGGLRVVTVGTDISTSLNLLWKRMFDHDHSSQNSMPTKAVRHSQLKGLLPTGSPNFTPSAWDEDDHTQYLHREGAGARDLYQNGMLGDLFLMSTTGTSNYDNTAADSNKIRFGHSTNGPTIGYDKANETVSVANKSFHLSTASCKYTQGTQSNYVWMDLKAFPGAGWVLSTDFPVADPAVDTADDGCFWISSGGGAWGELCFETSDWPEGMSPTGIVVDYQDGGGVNTIYFYQATWPAGSGSTRLLTQLTRSGGGNNYVSTGGAGARQLITYPVLAPKTGWSHVNAKLIIRVPQPGLDDSKFFGIAIASSYTSVSKFTP